jgi:hypothetical protein
MDLVVFILVGPISIMKYIDCDVLSEATNIKALGE